MENHKIINVLNDPSNHPSNFATKNGISLIVNQLHIKTKSALNLKQ